MSRKTTSTDTGVERVSRNKAKTQENKLDRSTNCLGFVEIVIRKDLKSSIDSQMSMRYLEGVKIA